MTLKTDIDTKLKESIRSRDEVGKNLFRYLKGEIALIETREGKAITEEKIIKIIRQLAESDETNLTHLEIDDPRRKETQAELHILNLLLPKTLSEDDIKNELKDMVETLKSVPEGQAIGLAIKQLKSKNLLAEGKTVTTVVKSLRA